MQSIFTKIVSILAAPIFFVGGLLGITHDPVQNLGAALPQAVGVFETSLSAPITSTASSMTLTANAIRGGGALSGYNCFTVDEGAANAEVICGTVATLNVTSLQRGLSYANGTTTISTNQFSHRRGANVKITDFPIIQIVKAQNNGETTFENPLKYASTISTTTLALNNNYLASIGYVNNMAFSGIPAASELASGFAQLATGLQAASSTSLGSTGARLILPASIATSTPPTSGNVIVATNGSGDIDPGFIPLLDSNTYLSSTASSTNLLTNIAKNIQIFTTSGNFSVPTGIKKVIIEGVGGGGGGGSCSAVTSANVAVGAGGGAGSYFYKIYDVSATSTLAVAIGAGGATTVKGGTTTVSNFLTAEGGLPGGASSASSASGGTSTGGDINIPGKNGGIGKSANSNEQETSNNYGADSMFGVGGKLTFTTSGTTPVDGNNGLGYGSGGGGAFCRADGNTRTATGGTGTNGLVKITW